MHQIISGEIPKKKIYKNISFDKWLEKEVDLVKNIINKKTVYAKNGLSQPSFSYTYLNQSVKEKYSLFKKIFQKEHSLLEENYSYLGDYLFCNIFDINHKKSKSFIFTKSMKKNFVSSIDDDKIKKIANYIFDNASIEYTINIDFKKLDKIVVDQKNKINFKLEYDFDYFRNNTTFNNYKFIVIDGYIEKISEVNHALVKSYDEKIPYVIFCHGVDNHVKETIVKNNNLGKTFVYIVDIKFDENSINSLKDIAILHNSEVISADKGQTISQAISKSLSVGKNITFKKDYVNFEMICSNSALNSYKKFLFEKKKNTENDDMIRLIDNRIKNINLKSIEIYLPEHLRTDLQFIREINYFINFFKNIGKKMLKISDIPNKKFYFVPEIMVELANKKYESLLKNLENINNIILIEEKKCPKKQKYCNL